MSLIQPRGLGCRPDRQNPPPDGRCLRMSIERLLQSRNPIRVGAIVIISEGDNRRTACLDSGIAAVRYALPSLEDVSKQVPFISLKLLDDLRRAIAGVVVDDNHLEVQPRGDLAPERFERGGERHASVARADHNRYVRSAVHTTRQPRFELAPNATMSRARGVCLCHPHARVPELGGLIYSAQPYISLRMGLGLKRLGWDPGFRFGGNPVPFCGVRRFQRASHPRGT